jgi:hypothetical protein
MGQNHTEDAILAFRRALSLSHELTAYEGLIHAYLQNNHAKQAFFVAKPLFENKPVARTMTLLAVATQHLPGKLNEVF